MLCFVFIVICVAILCLNICSSEIYINKLFLGGAYFILGIILIVVKLKYSRKVF